MVLFSSLCAAGVSDPGASAFRGVHDGGGIEVRLLLPAEERDSKGTPPRRLAFVRRLFAASLDNLCERRSRELGSAMRNGVAGVGMSAGSSDCDKTRGVALSVPHVMSCFTAAGPSSDGVGDGIEGTREWISLVGDLGWSMRTVSELGHITEMTRCTHMVYLRWPRQYGSG